MGELVLIYSRKVTSDVGIWILGGLAMTQSSSFADLGSKKPTALLMFTHPA